ncbi:hypothetical protein NDU88_004083 [Pleurodeles waltl]|uniref:Uncharacterized protein n=1 Tax=Pleurodeles waltl TaxID=8319 RepID=A0AAV7WUV8_PLEWA|nr:hypothetical protein NDU88_004083 [Pleurodeles waltl]
MQYPYFCVGPSLAPYLISDPMGQLRRASLASARKWRPAGAPRGSVVRPARGGMMRSARVMRRIFAVDDCAL